MRYILYTMLLWALPIGLSAQATWLEPADAAADDTVRLYVDLNKTENANNIIETAAGGEDMYIWTWKPVEHPEGHPLVNGLGTEAWKNSNPALKMTKESDGVYYYTMVPTEFYEVDANTVYAEDFHFLVKPQDGGGFGDPDFKTEDLVVKIEPAGCDPRKVGTFPDVVDANNTLPMTGDEVMVFIYDNKMELKPSLQNYSDSLFIYARGITASGASVRISRFNEAGDYPELQMVAQGDGVYHWYFVPDEVYSDVVSAGDKIEKLRLQIVKPNAANSEDAVDGIFEYFIRQE